MKFSNFRLVKTEGTNALDWIFFAHVDVTTGYLWWKKTITRPICRYFGNEWFFGDTGTWVPGIELYALARAYQAQTGKQT